MPTPPPVSAPPIEIESELIYHLRRVSETQVEIAQALQESQDPETLRRLVGEVQALRTLVERIADPILIREDADRRARAEQEALRGRWLRYITPDRVVALAKLLFPYLLTATISGGVAANFRGCTVFTANDLAATQALPAQVPAPPSTPSSGGTPPTTEPPR